ncbi:MAG: VTT domain-containing protein [Burkholderiales bacterium]
MEQMTGLLAQHGLALVFLNVLLTQAGAPVPAVPMMIVAGALSVSGDFSPGAVVAMAVVASLLGDAIWYAGGRLYGHRVLKTLCRISIEPDSCVKQTEGIFERWGALSLLVAKFVPGFATVAPPLAGAMRLGVIRFAFYSSAGAALWAGAAVAAGVVFAREVDWLLQWLTDMGGRAALVVGGVFAVFIAYKWWERRRFIRKLRMARISPDELHVLMRDGAQPVILDVRSNGAREIDPRRIPGARPVDLAAPERQLAGVPPEYEVVVYCT